MLVEAMAFAQEGKDPSEAIYAQEARGQQALVTSTQLPVEGSPGHTREYRKEAQEDEKKAWALMGIEWGDAQENELFRDATLPEGWKKERTDHSMWSDLLDEKGRKRAAIFYKAAFYDRKAHMHLERRFHLSRVYKDDNDDLIQFQFEVTDCGKQVFLGPALESEPYPGHEDRDRHSAWVENKDKVVESAKAPAAEWLEERYPEWESYAAYWD
jgi:hypothetical protein